MRADADMLRRLASLGLSPEQLAGVVAIIEDEDEARRAAKREGNRERQTRRREAILSRVVTRDEPAVTRDTPPVTRDPLSPKKGSPEPPPKNNPSPHAFSDAGAGEKPSRVQLMAEFEDWYGGYPHKVGKRAAEKAYASARERGATAGDLKTGVFRYRASKPPDQPYCHPATWLNQDRWQDDPAPNIAARSAGRRGMTIDHSPTRGAPPDGIGPDHVPQRRGRFADIAEHYRQTLPGE